LQIDRGGVGGEEAMVVEEAREGEHAEAAAGAAEELAAVDRG